MEKGRNSSVGVRKKAESERDEKELNENFSWIRARGYFRDRS